MILEDSESTHAKAADLIARGGVIAFRTDTFYGLGVDPFNESAVQRIKALKGREDRKPILVLISDLDQLNRLTLKGSAAFNLLSERLWPGPLTIIANASSELSDELTAGTKTVGVRLPDDDKVRVLLRSCGGTLTATSANPATLPPAKTANKVLRYFGEQIELIVDDGPAKAERPSTVVDARTEDVKLVREGIISWVEIQSFLR